MSSETFTFTDWTITSHVCTDESFSYSTIVNNVATGDETTDLSVVITSGQATVELDSTL